MNSGTVQVIDKVGEIARQEDFAHSSRKYEIIKKFKKLYAVQLKKGLCEIKIVNDDNPDVGYKPLKKSKFVLPGKMPPKNQKKKHSPHYTASGFNYEKK